MSALFYSHLRWLCARLCARPTHKHFLVSSYALQTWNDLFTHLSAGSFQISWRWDEDSALNPTFVLEWLQLHTLSGLHENCYICPEVKFRKEFIEIVHVIDHIHAFLLYLCTWGWEQWSPVMSPLTGCMHPSLTSAPWLVSMKTQNIHTFLCLRLLSSLIYY